ncbi:MAG TPA: SDR family oxidoreductase [Bryobacteraceae bacterium]|nr:SDR family oxidoreductase [Bryobacteraceae bacterium]
MNGPLEGKRAVVTGGTRGIGRAIASSLIGQGARVAICGRDENASRTVAQELGGVPHCYGAALDVREPDAVARFFEFADSSLGGLDVLVNNAGLGIFSPVGDLSLEDWRVMLDTNLTGVFHCCREAIPRLRKSGGGSIVNISSLAGKNPFAGGAAYNASKFGLNGFSEAMMLDHRNEGIRVTYVMPGSVDTDFSPRSARASWKIAPEDIADAVVFVLQMPARTTVSRIEVRPSIPPK